MAASEPLPVDDDDDDDDDDGDDKNGDIEADDAVDATVVATVVVVDGGSGGVASVRCFVVSPSARGSHRPSSSTLLSKQLVR
jgi:hypothetical protein